MWKHRCLIALFVTAAAACSRESDDPAPALTPMPPGLEGTYSGDFPCSNCPSIAASLWLRPDGRFFLRQSYLGEDGSMPGPSAYALGHWRWDEASAAVILVARGPERRLVPRGANRFELVTASATAHVLERDAAGAAFADTIRLEGESAIADGNGTFAECSTGLTLPIAKERAFDDLRRLHRRMNRSGRITLTVVDAHLAFTDTAGEVLVLDRVLELRPGVGCAPPIGGIRPGV